MVLIDLGLPDEAGEVLIAYVRRNTASRIVVLTGRDDIQTRVACYRMGAHLFLAKPVDPIELIAAVNSLLADSQMVDSEPTSPSVPAPGGGAVVPDEEWVLKLSKRTLLTPSGGRMLLSGGEFELLHILAVNGGKASHDELQQQLYGRADPSALKGLENRLGRIRRKIAAATGVAAPILNPYGVGFVFASRLTLQ